MGPREGETDRYFGIPSERLVIRERNAWYPPSRLRTLRYRVHKKRESLRVRESTREKEEPPLLPPGKTIR